MSLTFPPEKAFECFSSQIGDAICGPYFLRADVVTAKRCPATPQAVAVVHCLKRIQSALIAGVFDETVECGQGCWAYIVGIMYLGSGMSLFLVRPLFGKTVRTRQRIAELAD